jgi:hypothetical protein
MKFFNTDSKSAMKIQACRVDCHLVFAKLKNADILKVMMIITTILNSAHFYVQVKI